MFPTLQEEDSNEGGVIPVSLGRQAAPMLKRQQAARTPKTPLPFRKLEP